MTAVSDNLSSVAVAYAAADDIIAASLEEAKKVRASAIAAQEAELQRIEDEKAAEVERLRVLVRSFRPLDSQIGLKVRNIDDLEGKLAANQEREKTQAAVVAELEEKLREAQEAAAETVGIVQGQLARLHGWREELTGLLADLQGMDMDVSAV